MRTFLIRSTLLLACALLITIGIFLWLNSATVLPAISQQVETFTQSASSTSGENTNPEDSTLMKSLDVPHEGIKLSSLALGDSQKEALESVGINVEAFVITETMISCGVGKLGDGRATEIFAGATPTLIEIGTLLPCLRN